MADDDHSEKGYREFWEKTCDDKTRRLRSYANTLANGRFDLADDLVQGTLCCALTSCKNPAEIKTTPLRYLLGIMRNLWIDGWRSENRANVESLDQLSKSAAQHPIIEPDVLRTLEHEERLARFEAEHGPLDQRERQLLTLHLNGYRNQDIADELHEDVKVIRYDLNAVKSKVRYRLKVAMMRTAKSGRS